MLFTTRLILFFSSNKVMAGLDDKADYLPGLYIPPITDKEFYKLMDRLKYHRDFMILSRDSDSEDERPMFIPNQKPKQTRGRPKSKEVLKKEAREKAEKDEAGEIDKRRENLLHFVV